MLFDPCGAFGTNAGNPLGLPSVPLGSSAGPLTINFALGYTPDDPTTVAIEIIQAGITYGPYSVTVTTDAFGVSSAALTLNPGPAGLVAGPVTLQPGTLIASVFTAVGAPILGTLGDGLSGDLGLTVGPPLTNIFTESNSLSAGSIGFVHVLVSAVDTTDTAVDLTPYPVEIAVVGTSPLSGDWQTGDWLPVSSGTYARLTLTAGNALEQGVYFVYVRVNGVIIVRGCDILWVTSGGVAGSDSPD